jgi:hypothetical protein
VVDEEDHGLHSRSYLYATCLRHRHYVFGHVGYLPRIDRGLATSACDGKLLDGPESFNCPDRL